MPVVPVVLVRDLEGEWEALYVDGRLACDAHSLDALTVLEALDGLQVTIGTATVRGEQRFPERLDDFKAERWVECKFPQPCEDCGNFHEPGSC